MLANASAGMSCSTKQCFIPAFSELAKMRLKSTIPLPTGSMVVKSLARSLTCHSGKRPGFLVKSSTGSS